MKKHAATFLAPLFLLAAAALWFGVRAEPEPDRPDRFQTKRVATSPVVSERIARRLRFSGVIRATDRAVLSFTLAGRLLERPVAIGETVRAGQIVAQLDRKPFLNNLSVARGQLAELEARRDQSLRDSQRDRQLVAEKAAPAEELENVQAHAASLEAAITAARAHVDEAERQLEETSLRAPFDGTVIRVDAEPGELIAGQGVLMISGDARLELEVAVPETIVTQLKADTVVAVGLPMFGNRIIEGRLAHPGRAAAGPGKLFPVVIRLDNEDLIPGQSAELLLDLNSEPKLTVPIDAVLNPGGNRPRVFRVRDSRVLRVPVDIGLVSGTRVSVNGDLVAGDRVVTGGFFGLADGETVEVVQ